MEPANNIVDLMEELTLDKNSDAYKKRSAEAKQEIVDNGRNRKREEKKYRDGLSKAKEAVINNYIFLEAVVEQRRAEEEAKHSRPEGKEDRHADRQCVFVKKDGARCKNNKKYGDYCHVELHKKQRFDPSPASLARPAK